MSSCHRPTISEIKQSSWYNGPKATKEEVIFELSKRKIIVKQEFEKERLNSLLEKKEKERMKRIEAIILKESPKINESNSKIILSFEEKNKSIKSFKKEHKENNFL